MLAEAHDDVLNRVAVASGPIEAGQVVHTEDPLMSWTPADSPDARLAAFHALPAAERARVLQLWSPEDPLAGHRGRSPEDDRVLLIISINAHRFMGRYGALFATASALQHSCNPNVAYSSASGKLVYRAIRAIPAGARLTFSYLGAAELLLPTRLRRGLLQASKLFECHCERCDGEDGVGEEPDETVEREFLALGGEVAAEREAGRGVTIGQVRKVGVLLGRAKGWVLPAAARLKAELAASLHFSTKDGMKNNSLFLGEAHKAVELFFEIVEKQTRLTVTCPHALEQMREFGDDLNEKLKKSFETL